MRASRVTLCALLVAACAREGPPRPERPAAPPRGPLGVPGLTLDAGETGMESRVDAALPDPVARCVASARSATPAVVAEALAVVDEPAFIESACRLDVAVRLRAPGFCDGVTLSSLREVCLSRAAMVAAMPERCPYAVGSRGRDPVCVAIAARDLGLCAAATTSARLRCEALARRDPARCERLDPLLRPACVREVSAVRSLLPEVRARSRAASVPSVATLSGDADAGTEPLAWAARGLFLDEEGALWAVDPAAGWPTAWAFGVDAPVVAVRVPRGRRDETVRAEAALILPRLRALRTEDGTLAAEARWREVPRARGDRAEVEVTLRGAAAGVPVIRTLRVDAFVRDVVPAAALRQDAP